VTPRRETLVLTLTSDPALARLARRVAMHFFVQNGINRAESRKKSRLVEGRCRALLRPRRPARGGPRGVPPPAKPLILTLVAGDRVLEVLGHRRGGAAARRVLEFERPAIR
jgi:hypothetical protein